MGGEECRHGNGIGERQESGVMVAKISMGSSLYGALAYNGEKINEARGKLLATNKIYNDGTGTVDIGRALNDFLLYMPSQTREDRLTDTDLQNIAREYLEKLGFGEQPYMVYKHEGASVKVA